MQATEYRCQAILFEPIEENQDRNRLKADAYYKGATNLFNNNELQSAIELFLKFIDVEYKTSSPRKEGLADAKKFLGAAYRAMQNLNLAMEFAQQSLEDFKEVGITKGIAESLELIGAIDLERGKLTEALANFTQSLGLWKQFDNWGRIAECYNNIAIVQYKMRNIDEAITDFKRSLEINSELCDTNKIINILNKLSWICDSLGQLPQAFEYYKMASEYHCRVQYVDKFQIEADFYQEEGEQFEEGKQYEDALQHYRKSIESERKSKVPRSDHLITALAHAGKLYYETFKMYDSALVIYRQGLDLSKATGDTNRILGSLKLIGAMYALLGHYSECLEYFNIYLKMSRSLNDTTKIVEGLTMVTRILLEQKEFKKAINNQYEVLKLAEAVRDTNVIIGNQFIIGEWYDSLGNFSKSAVYYNKVIENGGIKKFYDIAMSFLQSSQYQEAAIALHRSLALKDIKGDTTSVSTILETLGTAYFYCKQYLNGEESFRRAIRLAEERKDTSTILRCLNNLTYFCSAGDRFNDAIEFLTRESAICRKIADSIHLAENLNDLGVLRFKQKQYDDAIPKLKEAIAIKESLRDTSKFSIILENLGSVYDSLGHYNDAAEYYQRSFNYRTDVEKLDLKQCKADIYMRRANQSNQAYRFQDAVEKYLEAYKEELLSPSPRKLVLGDALSYAGQMYYYSGKLQDALDYTKRGLSYYREINNKNKISFVQNLIGGIYVKLKNPKYALIRLDEALSLARELNDSLRVAECFCVRGQANCNIGHLKSAISYFDSSLVISEMLGRKADIAQNECSLGELYSTMGQYNKALQYYQRGLKLRREVGDNLVIVQNLQDIGHLYLDLHEYEMAFENFKEAMSVVQQMNDSERIATTLNGMGRCFLYQKKYPEAFQCFDSSRKIYEQIGNIDQMVRSSGNMGLVASEITIPGLEKVLSWYAMNTSLEVLSRINRGNDPAEFAVALTNLGTLCYNRDMFKDSKNYLTEAINTFEELRCNAPDKMKKEYFEKMFPAYQLLISSNIRIDETEEALGIAELSHAKYLVEQLGSSLDAKAIQSNDIRKYQKILDDTTAVLCFSNIDLDSSIVFVVSRDIIHATEIGRTRFVSVIQDECADGMKGVLANFKDRHRKHQKELNILIAKQGMESNFDDIITYYRILLKDQLRDDYRQFIAKELYKYLFGNVEKYLVGKTRLIIIPNGILSFLPFETLITPDDRYLVEKYDIQYTQSLNVLDLLQRRHYSANRKPILAFGGAIYDPSTYQTDMKVNDDEVDYIKNQTIASFRGGESLSEIYSLRGYGGFSRSSEYNGRN